MNSRVEKAINGSEEEKLFFNIINILIMLKKHKISLFKAKPISQPNTNQVKLYIVEPRLKNVDHLFLKNYPKENLKVDLLNYHPYILLWLHRKSCASGSAYGVFESSATFSQEHCQEVLADLNADYYWFKEQLHFAPFAAQVRSFEAPAIKQLEEAKTYFKRFFRADNVFVFYDVSIPFIFENSINQKQQLIVASQYRTKLISYLKNNDVINSDCRYVWKVFIDLIDFKLKLHLCIIKKVPKNKFLECKEQGKFLLFKDIITGVAKKLEITLHNDIGALFGTTSHSLINITKEQQKIFNNWLDQYFLKAIWYPICRVKCKNPRKMLFGKGNDKEEQ